MDDEDPGYIDAMLDVIDRIAEIEDLPLEIALDNVLSSDSDVLRVRVAHRDSDGGQLPLAADVALREHARRALLSAACSVVKPAAFHPRLSRSEADQLLAACRAGQTEVGSYVVKILCPLHAVDEGLGILDPRPFTRRVTSHLMLATSGLVSSIEQSSVDAYIAEHEQRPMVSANLCEAILGMQADRDAGQVELGATWGVDPRVPPPLPSEVPSRVVIKAEYLPEIERAARILRAIPAVAHDEELIGTVDPLRSVRRLHDQADN